MHVAQALFEGGMTVMEIPMTTPDALQTIAAVKKSFGDKIVIGVGSIVDVKTARAAMVIGADFVVTPVTKVDVIRVCNRYLRPVISGAFTPTEALHADESGADLVKIFPADNLGPAYIRSLLAPLPMLRLVPTGGVNHKNAAEYLTAGSAALAVSTAVVPKEAVQSGDWKQIAKAAEAFIDVLRIARSVR
jgi:2-dehydro-3-deoxyphosphogluconate aldolase/(4S)-4-hydroxy-2-oxoglutarate aldolase